jgi:hypothetical protein
VGCWSGSGETGGVRAVNARVFCVFTFRFVRNATQRLQNLFALNKRNVKRKLRWFR